MRGRNEKSKHGVNEHSDPSYGWANEDAVDAASSQCLDEQSDYPSESTPRWLGGPESASDLPNFSNSYDSNSGYTTSRHYGNPAAYDTHNSGGNYYPNSGESWEEEPSYGSTETPQEYDHRDKGKGRYHDRGPTNHVQVPYSADTPFDRGMSSRSGGASASDHYGHLPNAMHGDEGSDDEDEDDEYGNQYNNEDDYDEGEMARAVQESRRGAYYGHDPAAGSSSAASAYAPATTFDEDDVAQTPRAMDPSVASLSSGISNFNLDGEDDRDMGLDRGNFSVVESRMYRPGSVFKMLWSEPRGKGKNNSKSMPPPTEKAWSHADKFYVGVRRFLIVATDPSHHSTCVPISTYEHRACNKPGVQPSTHGIIYSQGRYPVMLDGERELGYNPVSCIMMPYEKLDKESRVNYSKLVTIEHNVEVQFIGTIADSDFAIVSDAVDDCWQRKNRHADSKSKSKSSKSKSSSKHHRSKPESESKHKSSSDKKHSRKPH